MAQKRRRWTSIGLSVSFLLIGAASGIMLSGPEWRSGDAPAMQKLEVVTHGYLDKKGVWRSYETGEPITVKSWR